MPLAKDPCDPEDSDVDDDKRSENGYVDSDPEDVNGDPRNFDDLEVNSEHRSAPNVRKTSTLENSEDLIDGNELSTNKCNR